MSPIPHIISEPDLCDYYPMVNKIAYRLIRRLPATIEVSELINTGFIGLLEALRRFDRSKGVPFFSYAEIRIRGAMIDFLRKLDWVPRSVRRRAENLEETIDHLTKKLGLPPSETQIASAMGIKVIHLAKYRRESKICRLVSIDSSVAEEDSVSLHECIPGEHLDAATHLENEEAKQILRQELQKLSEKERKTIEMYYYERQNLRQIGKTLGVTESRVCQIRSSAIRHLRSRLSHRNVTTALA